MLILAVTALQNQSAVDAHAAGSNRAVDGPAARAPANDRKDGILDTIQTDSDRLPVIAVTTDGAKVRCRRLRDIAEPAQLRSVHAESAEVDDSELEALAAAKELKFLALPGFEGTKPADITDAGLEKISRLSSLSYLSLGTERGTDVGVSQLRRLTGLRRLELYAPRATDASMIRLGELPDLMAVALHVPRMTDAGLTQFRALNDLLELDVSGTAVTGSAVLDYRLGPRYRYPNARASGGGREFELRELTSTAAGPGYGGNGSGSG
ncbi:MAG TPA: hypothetical protein VG125_20505, partial [Pirellulales bacterium]|nr:hypothetical protein [Pirellulales bacterium]